MNRILAINESTHVSAADFADMIEAQNLAFPAFCADYNFASFTVQAAKSPKEAKPGDVIHHVMQEPDAPGAGGYHDVDGHAIPYIKTFVAPYLDNGGTVVSQTAKGFNASALGAFSHENFEFGLDPACNLYTTMTAAKETAYEACDAGEDMGWPVTLKSGRTVWVSTYLLRAWFTPNAAGPYDHTGKMPGPFKLSPLGGGYMIMQNLRGQQTQQTSDEQPFDDDEQLLAKHASHLGARILRHDDRVIIAGPKLPKWRLDLKLAHGRLGKRMKAHQAAP